MRRCHSLPLSDEHTLTCQWEVTTGVNFTINEYDMYGVEKIVTLYITIIIIIIISMKRFSGISTKNL